MFNAIGEFSLNEILTKRLTTPGGSNAPSVAPEIFPTLVLENDRPEWGYLKGELLGAVRFFKAAVAAEFNMAQFYLPTTARTIATIERIQARTADPIRVYRAVGIGGGLGAWAAVNVATRDTRWNGERTGLIVEQNDNVALPSRFVDVWQSSGLGDAMTSPLVIAPGGSFVVSSNVVNVDLSFNIAWRERGAQPGELV